MSDDRVGQTSLDPDAMCVERIRRHIARYDRWRWAFLAFYTALAIGFVVLAVAFGEFVQRLGNAPGVGLGFAVGLTLGTMLGLLAVKIAHGLVGAMLRPGRSLRLLVRYHDALQELSRLPDAEALPHPIVHRT